MNKKEGTAFASGYVIGTLKVLFLLALIVGTVWIIKNQRDTPYQHDRGMIFGTIYEITYQHADNLQAGLEAELLKVDSALSMFNKQSVITRINNGEQQIPDNETGKMFLDVYQLAMQVSADTDGAFDITVAPLVNAWGFGFKSDTMPSATQVDSLRQFVGYKKITLNPPPSTLHPQPSTLHPQPSTLHKQDPRIMLDCSAIAKGYGCDVVARYLEQQGVTNYMVMIGGEIVTRGINPKRLPWRIGVTKPTDDSLNLNEETQTVLNVTDKAMATSGNYRRFYYKNGRKYAHTIDPKTGYPVQHSLLSATVLAKDCATADAYATSFMVMGMERAKQLLARHNELMAYFIYTDEKGELAVWYSPTLEDKIEN